MKKWEMCLFVRLRADDGKIVHTVPVKMGFEKRSSYEAFCITQDDEGLGESLQLDRQTPVSPTIMKTKMNS